MNLSDIYNIEGEAESEADYYKSLQSAINSGSAWSFQGSYGRSMMEAIEAGQCCLGRSGARDYYGNYIPSRDEVKSGTKGSLAYVRKHAGDNHARMIGRVK
jgi:hypothetical protein